MRFGQSFNCSPEEGELRDTLESLAKKNSKGEIIAMRDAVTISEVTTAAPYEFALWLGERKNRRAIPHRFEQCGYTPVRNDSGADGLWSINGTRQAIYAKANLSKAERIKAANALKRKLDTK
jgi:hypothetical protein